MNFLQRIGTASPQPTPEPTAPTPIVGYEELILEGIKVGNDAALLGANAAIDCHALVQQLFTKLDCMELRLAQIEKKIEAAAAFRTFVDLAPINRHIM
jgi:hypothetical protein